MAGMLAEREWVPFASVQTQNRRFKSGLHAL